MRNKLIAVLLLFCIALLCGSTKTTANKKLSVPLWLRREHYAEERGWCAMCETWEQDHIADADKMVEPDPQEVEWLAIAIFCEVGADAQSNLTRYRVGDVILTRVADDRFPDTVYKVLTQKKAYGRFYWTDVVWPKRASDKGNLHAVDRAREIAYRLLTDQEHSDLWGKGYIWQDDHERGKDNVWSDGVCFGR